MDKIIPTREELLRYRDRSCDSLEECEWKYNFREKFDLNTEVYEENGKFGVKDILGEVLVPAKFDAIDFTFHDDHRDNLVAVALDGKMALVIPDGKGTLFTEFEYDSIHLEGVPYDVFLGFYVLKKGDKYGLADEHGHIYIPVEADGIDEPCYDTIPYHKNEKWGFVSISSGIRTDAIYDDFRYDEDSYLEVIKEGKVGYIDSMGNFTENPEEKSFNGRYEDYFVHIEIA